MHSNASAAPLNAVAAPVGPLDWRRVVGWLREDGVISPEEAERLAKVLAELADYERDTLYPLATEQVQIDLDDGVKVNYLKLGDALKKIAGLEAKDED